MCVGRAVRGAQVKPGGGRQKGHAFERWCAIQLRDIFPEAKRGLQGRGGAEAPDVDGTGWWIETKCGGPAKKPNAALVQAELDAYAAKDSRLCVVICKQDRKQPTATMRLGTIAPGYDAACATIPVTMSFDDWLTMARRF